MDIIRSIDTALILFVNHFPHERVGILFASFLSGIGPIGFITIVCIVSVSLYIETKNHWFAVTGVITLFLSYVFSEEILKPLIARPRPFEKISTLFFLERYPGWSFPSTHTTVAFAGAYILSHYLPRYKIVWYVSAVLVGLSRMYLGAHYPTDVFGGMVVGLVCGVVGMRAGEVLHKEIKSRK